MFSDSKQLSLYFSFYFEEVSKMWTPREFSRCRHNIYPRDSIPERLPIKPTGLGVEWIFFSCICKSRTLNLSPMTRIQITHPWDKTIGQNPHPGQLKVVKCPLNLDPLGLSIDRCISSWDKCFEIMCGVTWHLL